MTGEHSEDERVVEAKPSEFLKRVMALYGLSAKGLAAQLGLHQQTIYNITSRERDISAELAEKLAEHFGTAVKTWRTNPVRVPLSQWESWVQDATQLGKSANEAGRAGPLFDDLEQHSERRRGDSLHVERTLIDTEIHKLILEKHSVEIDPFEPDQVQSASYDLTMGLIIKKGFRLLPEKDWVRLMKAEVFGSEEWATPNELRDKLSSFGDKVEWSVGHVTLHKDESATIFALETVAIDAKHLAEVGATASNAKRGLLVLHGFQVDPGYHGPMIVTVKNIGNDDIQLSRGQTLISLAFRELAQQPNKTYREAARRAVEEVIEMLQKEFATRLIFTEVSSQQRILAHTADGQIEAWADTRDEAEASAFQKCLDKVIYDDADSEVRGILNECMQATPVKKHQAEAIRTCLGISDSESKARLNHRFPMAGDMISMRTIFNLLEARTEDLPRILHTNW